MRVVVDIGCATHDQDESVRKLVAEYHPDVLYGFDPWPGLEETDSTIGGSRVILKREAAWVEGGHVNYTNSGIASHVGEGEPVRCFDLARFINRLPRNAEIILKIDAEGAEYPLLEHLNKTGAIKRVAELRIEWHADERVEVPVPVTDWH